MPLIRSRTIRSRPCSSLEQAGALRRAGDLCRIFADREAPVPEALATRTLEEAAAFIGA